MSGKYALVIGNTEYIDPGLAQLTAPSKDVEDFARVLKDQDLCAFDDVKVLLNQPESVAREAIDEFFNQKRPDDLLVLYFSGHGVRDELGALYLAVKNTNRLRLRSTAIKSDFIWEAMDQSRSKRQVLILDCCNSGAFVPGTKAAIGVSIGTATAFKAGYGRIVLTASDSTQFAWEGDQVLGETDNSLFTHFLVRGLEGEADLDSDGRITVDELYDYAYEQVRSATPKQTPSKFSSKQQGEIVLRQITRIEDIKQVSLPEEVIDAIQDSRTFVREGAVQELEKLLTGKNLGLARSAREALERTEKEDDSRRVSQAATQALIPIRQAEKLTLQKAEEERLAGEKAEAERKAREEAQKLERHKAEQEAVERETARLQAAREAVEKAANEKAEKEAAERAAMELASRKKAEREATERAEREANELASRRRAEQEAKRRVTVSQGKPTHLQSTLQQPVMKWVMVGIIGLCVIGMGAWGISYLAQLANPVVTQTPAVTPTFLTEVPTVEEPAGSGPVTSSGPVTITWWHISTAAEHTALWQKFADEYMAAHPNVTIEITVLENEAFKTKLTTVMQSGEPPDIFQSWGGGVMNEYATGGLLKDITPDLDADGGAWRKTFALGALGVYAYKGKNYGVPWDMGMIGFWYNKALFKQAGIDNPPTTWTELLDDVKKLKAAGITPIALGEGDKWPGMHMWAYLVTRLGGKANFEGALLRNGSFKDAPFVDAGKKLQELIALKPFQNGFLGATYGDQATAMGNGKAAMELTGQWAPAVEKDNSADKKGIGDNLGWFPFPMVEGGKGDPNDVIGGGNGFAIGKNASPEAIDFVKYLTTADAQKQLAEIGVAIPVVKGGEAGLKDPLIITLQKSLANAKYFQLYYDQALPPAMGSVINDSVQGLFAGTLTPEQVAQMIEDSAAQELK